MEAKSVQDWMKEAIVAGKRKNTRLIAKKETGWTYKRSAYVLVYKEAAR